MEFKQFILSLRRWLWLLTLALVVGLSVGLIVSRNQEPTYRASSQLLVSRGTGDNNTNFAGLNNEQLALTYVQILNSRNYRDAAAKRVGIVITSEQVKAQLVTDTQVIEIGVEDHDPKMAADIANTFADILIEENETIVAGRFSELEENLSSQIVLLEGQIVSLREQYHQTYQEKYQEQITMVQNKITELETELSVLQAEIAPLTRKLALYNSAPTYYKFSDEERALLGEKESQAAQIQSNLMTFNEMLANLLILGRPVQSPASIDDQEMLQLKATIDQYQEMYTNLLANYETTRLASLQRTPTIVIIEEAFVPESPVRPNITLNTLIGGMVGVVIVVMVVTLAEVMRDDHPGEMPFDKIDRSNDDSIWINDLEKTFGRKDGNEPDENIKDESVSKSGGKKKSKT